MEYAAEWEQRNHAYQNRSGELEASTRAHVRSRGENHIHVELVMDAENEYGVEYADFVHAKGLTSIDEAAELAEDMIDKYLSQFGD